MIRAVPGTVQELPSQSSNPTASISLTRTELWTLSGERPWVWAASEMRVWIAPHARPRRRGPALPLATEGSDHVVLQPYCGPSEYETHSQRVVEGQRLLQAASDVMLGWTRSEGLDGVERDFYIRQSRDGKVSPDYTTMSPRRSKSSRRSAGGLWRAGSRPIRGIGLRSPGTWARAPPSTTAIAEFRGQVRRAEPARTLDAAATPVVKAGKLASSATADVLVGEAPVAVAAAPGSPMPRCATRPVRRRNSVYCPASDLPSTCATKCRSYPPPDKGFYVLSRFADVLGVLHDWGDRSSARESRSKASPPDVQPEDDHDGPTAPQRAAKTLVTCGRCRRPSARRRPVP